MFLVLALIGAPFAYDGVLHPGQTLSVRDVNGSIRVRAGTRLSVRATKTATRSDPNAVAIRVDQNRGGIVVCVRYPPNAGRPCNDRDTSQGATDSDTRVDFDVTVPRGVALDAATVNGTIDAKTDGAVDAKTVNGKIAVEGREVRRVQTVNGSIAVRILDRPSGALDASTVNGSIDVSLPPGSGIVLRAHTLTGSINAPGVSVERPPFGPGANANGTLGDGSVRVSLASANGSITIHR